MCSVCVMCLSVGLVGVGDEVEVGWRLFYRFLNVLGSSRDFFF